MLDPDASFEIFLGRLLLRTELFDLKNLVALPDVLDQQGLELASDALLYALGYTERLEETCKNLEVDSSQFASQWRNVVSDRSLPDFPKLYNRQKATLHSRILGCQIIVECQNKLPCVEVAESLLAALESLLATSTIHKAIAREPELTLDINVSHFTKPLISFDLAEKGGRPHLNVHCRSFDPYKIGLEEQSQIKEILIELTVTILTQIIIFKDFEEDLEVLLGKEQAFQRAINFTGTFGTLANIFGHSPKTNLSAWTDDSVNTYPLLRTEPWKPIKIEDANKEDEKLTLPPEITRQEPPPELHDPNYFRHDEIETVSFIRERLWTRAVWSGVAFLTDPMNKNLPVLALIFKDRDAGKEIFVQWRQELGEIDIKEQLRITIVRGIDRTQPHAYRMIIGANPSLWPAENKLIAFMSRIHKMDATSPDNLNRFLKSHSIIDAFLITPAFVTSEFDGSQVPEVETNLGIIIHSVNVRNAWEIGPRDLDLIGISKGDKPIVPKDIDNPPVYDLLENLEAS